MPKHRSPGFAVVREFNHQCKSPWMFHGIVGVYQTHHRADEVASATIQKYLDLGMNPGMPEYRCSVVPTNWYDE